MAKNFIERLKLTFWRPKFQRDRCHFRKNSYYHSLNIFKCGYLIFIKVKFLSFVRKQNGLVQGKPEQDSMDNDGLFFFGAARVRSLGFTNSQKLEKSFCSDSTQVVNIQKKLIFSCVPYLTLFLDLILYV